MSGNQATSGERKGFSYLIVGAHSLTLELLAQMPPDSSITVIDVDTTFESTLRSKASFSSFHFPQGDPSSALVLEAAGIEQVDWVVCLLRSDRHTMEICRLARERFHRDHVLALVQSTETMEQLKAIGVSTIFENRSISLWITSLLFSGKQITRGIGLESGELMEVFILPSSPIVGVPMRVLNPRNWILAAIYRQGQVIIPHGDSSVEAGDRVLIVGEHHALPRIAEFIHRGRPDFPLSYGSEVLILQYPPDPAGVLAESGFLLNRLSSITGLVFSTDLHHPEGSETITENCCKHLEWSLFPDSLTDFLRQTTSLGRFGMVVVPARTKPNRLRHYFLGIPSEEEKIMTAADCPVLIARKTFPYKKILLCLSPSQDPLFLGTYAIELASQFEAELTAVTVTPPDLVLGKDSSGSRTAALDGIKKIAGIFLFSVNTKALVGNSVRILSKLSQEYDLAIISHSFVMRPRVFRPDASRLLIMSLTCSTLIIPQNRGTSILAKRGTDHSIEPLPSGLKSRGMHPEGERS
jgi:Trk K+ transport system NAD-binding subunit